MAHLATAVDGGQVVVLHVRPLGVGSRCSIGRLAVTRYALAGDGNVSGRQGGMAACRGAAASRACVAVGGYSAEVHPVTDVATAEISPGQTVSCPAGGA